MSRHVASSHRSVFFFAVWKSAFQLPRQRRCHMIRVGLGLGKYLVGHENTMLSFMILSSLMASWTRGGTMLARNKWSLFCWAHVATIRSFISIFHHIDLRFDSHVCRLHISRRKVACHMGRCAWLLWHLPPGRGWCGWKGHEGRTAWARKMRRGDTSWHAVCKTWYETWWNACAGWRFTWLRGNFRCRQCGRHSTLTSVWHVTHVMSVLSRTNCKKNKMYAPCSLQSSTFTR